MSLVSRSRQSSVAVLVAGAVLLGALSPAVLAQEAAAEAGGLKGKIVSADGSPVAGANVMLYHLASERSFESAATGADGAFKLGDLPPGYLDLAVQAPGGLYVIDRVIRIESGQTAVLSLKVSDAADSAVTPRDFPGLVGGDPIGTVTAQAPKGGGGFWTSAAGISAIAGAGLLILLAVSSGSSSEPSPSPFLP